MIVWNDIRLRESQIRYIYSGVNKCHIVIENVVDLYGESCKKQKSVDIDGSMVESRAEIWREYGG